jgi:hypothetical protein
MLPQGEDQKIQYHRECNLPFNTCREARATVEFTMRGKIAAAPGLREAF